MRRTRASQCRCRGTSIRPAPCSPPPTIRRYPDPVPSPRFSRSAPGGRSIEAIRGRDSTPLVARRRTGPGGRGGGACVAQRGVHTSGSRSAAGGGPRPPSTPRRASGAGGPPAGRRRRPDARRPPRGRAPAGRGSRTAPERSRRPRRGRTERAASGPRRETRRGPPRLRVCGLTSSSACTTRSALPASPRARGASDRRERVAGRPSSSRSARRR